MKKYFVPVSAFLLFVFGGFLILAGDCYAFTKGESWTDPTNGNKYVIGDCFLNTGGFRQTPSETINYGASTLCGITTLVNSGAYEPRLVIYTPTVEGTYIDDPENPPAYCDYDQPPGTIDVCYLEPPVDSNGVLGGLVTGSLGGFSIGLALLLGS